MDAGRVWDASHDDSIVYGYANNTTKAGLHAAVVPQTRVTPHIMVPAAV